MQPLDRFFNEFWVVINVINFINVINDINDDHILRVTMYCNYALCYYFK